MSVEDLAIAVDHVGRAVTGLTGELREARDQNKADLRSLRKVTSLVLAMMLVLVVSTVAVGWTLLILHDAVDPNGRVARSAAVRTRQALVSLYIENDCRSRRNASNLPAPPDPFLSCADQTPTDIYPGLEGQ